MTKLDLSFIDLWNQENNNDYNDAQFMTREQLEEKINSMRNEISSMDDKTYSLQRQFNNAEEYGSIEEFDHSGYYLDDCNIETLQITLKELENKADIMKKIVKLKKTILQMEEDIENYEYNIDNNQGINKFTKFNYKYTEVFFHNFQDKSWSFSLNFYLKGCQTVLNIQTENKIFQIYTYKDYAIKVYSEDKPPTCGNSVQLNNFVSIYPKSSLETIIKEQYTSS